MPLIKLGESGPSVFPMCLGCGEWGTRDGASEDALYETYRAAGGNFFDTAHCYAFWVNKTGISERLLAPLISHDKRDELVIATKGGHPGSRNYARPDDYLTPALFGRDLNESLDRLKLSYVDLYYLHRDDTRVPIAEIMDRLAELVRSGRVRHIAASNWTTTRIAEANSHAAKKGSPQFVASQPMWSLARLVDHEDPTLHELTGTDIAWHTKSKLPVVPFTPTAKGYFAEPFRDVKAYDNAPNRARRDSVKAIAKQIGANSNQVALAWMMHHPFPVIPILGTMNVGHLNDGLAAVKVRLTKEQIDAIEPKNNLASVHPTSNAQ